jgi:hypothetical protein
MSVEPVKTGCAGRVPRNRGAIYFVSEVNYLHDGIYQYLTTMLNKAKSGALLGIDNRTPPLWIRG